jgi:ADP-ribose pyrophosphatase YjhB (NUDIX family)
MRIYKKDNVIVGVNLLEEITTTRSAYPEVFFDNLKNNSYSFFSYKEQKVIEANEDFISFEDYHPDIKEKFEKYFFIGEAINKEELINLLNKKKEAVVLINYSKEGFLCCTRRNSHLFCFPGGKIEKGESPSEAIIREVKEETNINIRKEEISFFKEYDIFEYKAFIFVSFVQNLTPSINEPGIIPFFTSKEYLLSENALFKEFNKQFFEDSYGLY